MKSTAHRFRFYDSTTDINGNPAPLWSRFITLSINPIAYDGFGDKDLNEVESLYEENGTLVEETIFDYRKRQMEWNNIAKFKYFDEGHGVNVPGGIYPQFLQLASMEYHRSGEYYFLDDRGYTTVVNLQDMESPKQVYIQVRIDTLHIDGFATVPAPYFNKVTLEYTPIATFVN